MTFSLDQAPLQTELEIADGGVSNPRLLSIGFLPHMPVRVLQRSRFRSGPLVVQVGNAVFGLRPAEACQILLKPLNP